MSGSQDFLHIEYSSCHEQLRYYDTRHTEILKYLFAITSSVATALAALYKYFQGFSNDYMQYATSITLVVFVATLLLYLGMLQNRLYFVFTAKQINAIRGFLLRTEAPGFRANQLYTATDFPAIKPASIHTFQLIGAALVSALFGGAFAAGIASLAKSGGAMSWGAWVLVVIAVMEIGGGFGYLARQGKRSADEAIHGKGGATPGGKRDASLADEPQP